VTSTTPAVLLC